MLAFFSLWGMDAPQDACESTSTTMSLTERMSSQEFDSSYGAANTYESVGGDSSPSYTTIGVFPDEQQPLQYEVGEGDDTEDMNNEDNLIIDIDQPPEVQVSNGYAENCENIQISAETDTSIQIF